MTTETALTASDLRLLAEAGTLAPSLHNSQPWRFRPTPDLLGLEVLADLGRTVPAADPDGRALHISIGAALFNLRVAAAHLGRAAEVRLLPSGEDGQPRAVLDLSAPARTPSPFGPDLYPVVPKRHSSRHAFTNRDVPEALVGELIVAAREEGVTLTMLEEHDVRRVLALTAEAEARIAADVTREAETRRWLRVEPSYDGIPLAALGSHDRDARVPMRGFTGHPPHHATPAERFEALPQLATLVTHFDHQADWLRTGQAMERVWLLATAHGLRASVLHQAVEIPDTRWRLRDTAEGPGHVQLVLRLGYGPPGTAAPRRPVEDVLLDPVEAAG
ncbi:nitroreductase family protein [Streptomyces sp. FH025]|uniref:Acg family FMN-binding oxidoreductase n=1 Tax=Streptomyces sp. FH025 TaxID=2815937 RepID=UPI001A9DE20A|nr:nitroreductase family protein [Streptomyces sp. FH025]MBO1414083.1 nitroreductase family protein [Streptomyces sp. FH025]